MEQYLMAKLKWERSALTREAVHATLSDKLPDLAAEWDALWSASGNAALRRERHPSGRPGGNLEVFGPTN